MDSATLNRIGEQVSGWAASALEFFYQPSSLAQIGAIAVCFLIALALNRLTRGPLEAQARKIRAAPSLLRIIVAIRRRMKLVYFVFGLWILTLIDSAAGGPRSSIISVVFNLGLAYLVISVASRILRNKLASRIIAIGAWIVAALSILDLLDPVSKALDATAINIGASRISALLVIKAVVVLALTFWLASVVGNFLDTRIKRSDELTPALRVLIGKLLKVGLVFVACLVGLAAVGVDLTALTVLSGALGVGLGFGLQKVVSNFISGIIILTDRSIKPGDTISLGDTFGWIRELRARFVSVITRDGREYLIPNEDFITNQVINWSFSNDLVRIDVTFGVSYDSNPHDVIRIAKEATTSVGRVVSDKPVVCWLTGFGDSSLDFIIRFWIKDPPAGLTNVRGEVLLALWDAFKENDIGIPFPHREILMRTPVTFARDRSFGGGGAGAGDRGEDSASVEVKKARRQAADEVSGGDPDDEKKKSRSAAE
ncbi:mechanosensitive ion channel family protein [Jiella mangrovi]|uniref:Mechanosensitive ion channel family protein n=1 Tax=Jiella mangrovi TaxID=2821407 RepID=A0ABS4BGV4_9HYPH|nr:mechanosensitive ion channel domain-containing protein [Jiella mangrovi]MBP0615426.1 mechanosensitive ion channel family protein [Jiella mangrovi]